MKKKVPEFLKRNKMVTDVLGYLYSQNAPLSLRFDSKSRLKLLKDSHRGERCFIVGNGPSLCAEDLELLQDEICFAANKIYKMYSQTRWRATYYCVQDLNIANSMAAEMEEGICNAEKVFFRMSRNKTLNELVRKNEKAMLVPLKPYPGTIRKMEFSDNAEKYLCDGGTVTYMEMQLAAYMGFEKVYLLGVDHAFPFEITKTGNVLTVDQSLPAHFYETSADNVCGAKLHGNANRKYFQDMSYLAASTYSKDTKKIMFYNATRGGKLNFFERVQLEDVLKANERDTN